MTLPKRLEDDIRQWCDANGVTDVDAYITECVEKQFNIDRYGDMNVIMGIAPPRPESIQDTKQEKQEEAKSEQPKAKKPGRKKKKEETQPEIDFGEGNSGTIIAGKRTKTEFTPVLEDSSVEFSSEEKQKDMERYFAKEVQQEIEKKQKEKSNLRTVRILKSQGNGK